MRFIMHRGGLCEPYTIGLGCHMKASVSESQDALYPYVRQQHLLLPVRTLRIELWLSYVTHGTEFSPFETVYAQPSMRAALP